MKCYSVITIAAIVGAVSLAGSAEAGLVGGAGAMGGVGGGIGPVGGAIGGGGSAMFGPRGFGAGVDGAGRITGPAVRPDARTVVRPVEERATRTHGVAAEGAATGTASARGVATEGAAQVETDAAAARAAAQRDATTVRDRSAAAVRSLPRQAEGSAAVSGGVSGGRAGAGADGTGRAEVSR